MKKYYITANELLEDSFKLAKLIHKQGFKPDFIIGIWRGGAPVGIAVQEYLDFIGIETDHIAIRTSSYFGIDKQHKEVKVYGLNYVIDNLTSATNLLIVDDVFDSGRSIQAVLKNIKEKAGSQTPKTIKTACPWYKPNRNTTDITPDFYIHTTDDWLVFPHELKGLSLQEIRDNKGEELFKALQKEC